MPKLDIDDPRPHYAQVADVFRDAIHTDRLKPGEKLPSHRDIATEYGVSVGTVKRAFGVLEADHLIVSRQGQGAYVRTRSGSPSSDDAIGTADLDELRRLVTGLAQRLHAVERRLAEL